MPSALESGESLHHFSFFSPWPTFYSKIIVTVIFFHVCLLIPKAKPEGAILALPEQFACPGLQLLAFHQTSEYFLRQRVP